MKIERRSVVFSGFSDFFENYQKWGAVFVKANALPFLKQKSVVMRKLTATLFFLLPLLLSAQTYPWEIGGGVYITAYQGDLHASEFNFGQYSPRVAGALHLRRNVSNSFIVRLNAMFGELAGDGKKFE